MSWRFDGEHPEWERNLMWDFEPDILPDWEVELPNGCLELKEGPHIYHYCRDGEKLRLVHFQHAMPSL